MVFSGYNPSPPPCGITSVRPVRKGFSETAAAAAGVMRDDPEKPRRSTTPTANTTRRRDCLTGDDSRPSRPATQSEVTGRRYSLAVANLNNTQSATLRPETASGVLPWRNDPESAQTGVKSR